MMQANAEFIPNFAHKSAVLRDITRGNKSFIWSDEHMLCFNDLLREFKDCTMLQYFDPNKSTFILVDAHITGLGATLAQGSNITSLYPVAFASRTTSEAETRYPQLDLEAMSIDFGLRRFRNFILGSPNAITVITDHKPLCTRHGSIRTERIKLRHQDVRFQVEYQPGKQNQADP